MRTEALLGLAIFSASAVACMAQGTVVFKNQASNPVKQWTSTTDQTYINVPKGGGQVQLFWANTGTAYTPWTISMSPAQWYAANPGWTLDTHLGGFTTPAAGQFTGGTLTLATATPGGTIDAVIIGWTGNYTSFDAALATSAIVGVSTKFTSPTGNPTTVPPGTPVSLQTVIPTLILGIPEPSTFALAGLGAAALLIFRRRR